MKDLLAIPLGMFMMGIVLAVPITLVLADGLTNGIVIGCWLLYTAVFLKDKVGASKHFDVLSAIVLYAYFYGSAIYLWL